MTSDSTTVADLFAEDDPGANRMFEILNDPMVSQIVINRHDRIFYTDGRGTHAASGRPFTGSAHYLSWLNDLMRLTDVGYTDISTAKTSVIEGSFNPDRTPIQGSIHICTSDITRGDPILTVRKQPRQIVTLDKMREQGMMDTPMRQFLEAAMNGRSNILISGGSGAGKTTLARALSWFIDPSHRILTAEEIEELHLGDRLPNVAALTTKRIKDENGAVIRETSLEDLVKEALRMRADRIWVGETRGREALALIKACNSGHDGSVTTCLSGDTLIVTAHGDAPIADLAGTEQTVLTSGGRWVKAPIRNFGRQGLHEVHLVRGDRTKTIRATTEHRWFTASADQVHLHTWAETTTAELTPGQVLESWRPTSNDPQHYWRVTAVTPAGEPEDVYCATVDEYGKFALPDDIMTGNCHADDSATAWKQVTTYVIEAGLPVDAAREQIARAFDVIVQINRVKMGRRVVSEITELESVTEGSELRRNPLYRYNVERETFEQVGHPTRQLLAKWARYGVNPTY